MSLHRYDAKRDANEPEIVKAFQSKGISVYRLDRPLDLLLGYNKKNYLVEVKMPKKGLNKKQVEFVQKWKGQHFVCYTVAQAEKFADMILNN
jgi:hypothetical protein